MSEQTISKQSIGLSARQRFNSLLAPTSKRGFLKHVACLAIFFLIRQLLDDQLQEWKLVQEEKANTYSNMMRNVLLGTHLTTSSVWAQEHGAADQSKEANKNDKENLGVEEDLGSIKMNNVVWDDSPSEDANGSNPNEKPDKDDEEPKNENEVGEPRTEEEGVDDAANMMMEQIMKGILGQAMGGLDLSGLGDGKLDIKALLQQILSKGKSNSELSALADLFGDLGSSDDEQEDADEELASEQPAADSEGATTASESSSTTTTTTESQSEESQKLDAQDSPKDEL